MIYFIIRGVLIVFLVSGVIGQAGAESLRIGFFELNPHAYSDKHDKARGTAIEYFRLIAEQMGVGVTFTKLPLARLTLYLKDGKVDAALTMGKNTEREAMFVYPEKPFFYMRGAIAIKKSHPLREVKSVEDILPLKMTFYDKGYRSPIMRDRRLQLTPMGTDDIFVQSYEMILKNRIDACYSPESYTLKFKLKEGTYGADLRVMELPEPPVGLFTPFSRQSAGKYLKKYETALTELYKTQSYEEKLGQFLLSE